MLFWSIRGERHFIYIFAHVLDFFTVLKDNYIKKHNIYKISNMYVAIHSE